LAVPGLTAEVKKASLLAGGSILKTESSTDGLIIHVPAAAPDALTTVIRVEPK
jgi:alpha-L-fucosidase